MTRTTKLLILGGVIALVTGTISFLDVAGSYWATTVYSESMYMLVLVLLPISFFCGLYVYRKNRKHLALFLLLWAVLLCVVTLPLVVATSYAELSGTIITSPAPPMPMAPGQDLVGSTPTSSMQ